jgi:hypothetical protein
MKRLRLHAASAVLLAAARSSLKWWTLRTTQRLLHRIATFSALHADPHDIARAITSASRRVPWKSTCLHHALAGEALMRAAGHDCALRIGARRQGNHPAFHAWLEFENTPVIGATDIPHAVLTSRLP